MDDGPLTGTTLAERFEIKELLGEGAMGEVYRAEHDTLGLQYAVKVLQEHVAEDERVVARFKREAHAASRLDHPHAVQIYDFGRTDEGLFYLVMEFVDGPTLASVISETAPKPMPRWRGVRLLVQVAQALQAAHTANIVHRDLSPSNVRIAKHRGDEDMLKILDFGLAKVLADVENPLSMTGEVFGTPRYMSPEQARGESVDHRADIYALGVLAFEVFTGRPPFTYDLLPQLLQAHMDEAPPKPSSLLSIDIPPLPAVLEAVILKCLEKTRDGRPDTVDEVLEILEQVLEAAPQPRAVPPDVGKVLETSRSGSSWAGTTHSWSPGDFAPTIPQTGPVLDSPSMHPGDPAYRIWYWSQALKLATSIAERLVRDELATPGLPKLLTKLEESEDRTVGAEADVALVEAELDELEAEIHQKAFDLKNEIVGASMTLDSLIAQDGASDGPQAALYQQIHDLEANLGTYRAESVGRQSELEKTLVDKRRILEVLRKTQMEREIGLLNTLDEARPDPCPFFYEKNYATVAEMLQALRISDGVDLPG
jgi:serine/threonine protein kinase